MMMIDYDDNDDDTSVTEISVRRYNRTNSEDKHRRLNDPIIHGLVIQPHLTEHQRKDTFQAMREE